MKAKIKIGPKDYQIEASEIKEGLLKVRIDDKDYFFTRNEFGEMVFLEDFQALSLKENGIILNGFKEKEIKSPLAGTISQIFIKKEEKIKPGQKIATLISMKMENEIISEGYGKVLEIKIKENQFVNTGDILITLA